MLSEPIGVGRDIQVALPGEMKGVAALPGHLLQQVDRSIHEPDHRCVGPPVAIALGRLVGGEGQRRPGIDEDDVSRRRASRPGDTRWRRRRCRPRRRRRRPSRSVKASRSAHPPETACKKVISVGSADRGGSRSSSLVWLTIDEAEDVLAKAALLHRRDGPAASGDVRAGRSIASPDRCRPRVRPAWSGRLPVRAASAG